MNVKKTKPSCNVPNIVVTVPLGFVGDSFFPEPVKRRLESLGNVRWNNSTKNWTAEELAGILKGADICITGWGTPKIDKKMLEGATELQLIAHTGGTVKPIVSDYVYQRGVKVLSGNAIFAESVAEGVLCYILASYRKIVKYANELKEGHWPGLGFYNRGLFDRTVGLVGHGMVAQYLIPLLKQFNVNILVCSDHLTKEQAATEGVTLASLEHLFTQSDVISLHLANTPKNYHRIDKKLLTLIKEGSLLVNTARGSVIDEKAMIQELSTKRFSAVLDVFEQEPLSKDSPLLNMEHVLCIPHMAGPTVDRREVVTHRILDDIERHLQHQPLQLEIDWSYSSIMTNQ